MAKLDRKEQKLFAGNASNNGQFGSGQAGTKVVTNDVDTLQALEAWQGGWNDATIGGNNLPPLEEVQSVSYVNSYHLKYILERGIAQWIVTESYAKHAYVQGSDNAIYMSIIEGENLGVDPSGNTSENWMQCIDENGEVPKGDFILTPWEDAQGIIFYPSVIW